MGIKFKCVGTVGIHEFTKRHSFRFLPAQEPMVIHSSDGFFGYYLDGVFTPFNGQPERWLRILYRDEPVEQFKMEIKWIEEPENK